MLKRRDIREKVLQTIYAEFIKEGEISQAFLPNANNTYNSFIKETEKIYFTMMDVLCQICKYANTIASLETKKHLTYNIDIIKANNALATNHIITEFQNTLEDYKKSNQRNTFRAIADTDIIHNMFLQLLDTEAYKKYISTTAEKNIKNEQTILIFILEHIVVNSIALESYLEDHYPNAFDDTTTAIKYLIEVIKKKKPLNSNLLNPNQENIAFGTDLLSSVYRKDAYLLELISPEITYWKNDRVFSLDMIILKLAVCEFLYFDNIPLRATLNEYIEISKSFSTAESKEFINGILDSIKNKLVKAEKISKL